MAVVPVITVNNVPVPSVPVASENIKSLVESVDALKANVEVLTGTHTSYHTQKTKSAVETALAVAISRTQNV